jgi:hypothetical protein
VVWLRYGHYTKCVIIGQTAWRTETRWTKLTLYMPSTAHVSGDVSTRSRPGLFC